MKNVRLLIIAIFLAVGAIFLGDFFISGNHPFSELAAGISCLFVSALFIVLSVRSSNK